MNHRPESPRLLDALIFDLVDGESIANGGSEECTSAVIEHEIYNMEPRVKVTPPHKPWYSYTPRKSDNDGDTGADTKDDRAGAAEDPNPTLRQTMNKTMKGSGSYMLSRKTACHILIIFLDLLYQGNTSSLSMKDSYNKTRNLRSIQSPYYDCEDTEVFRADSGAMLRKLAYIGNIKITAPTMRYSREAWYEQCQDSRYSLRV